VVDACAERGGGPEGVSLVSYGGRILAVVLTVLVPALTLARASACAETDEQIVLEVWGLPEDFRFPGTLAIVAEFEKRHPNIKVAIGSPGGRGGMDPQKLMTAVAGGSPPDIVEQDRFAIGGWAARGALRPLDDLIERDGFDVETRFYKFCVEEASYRGNVYAMPHDTDCRILYYNPKLLEEAGIPRDRPPRTWDELLDYAVKLTKRKEDGSFERVGFAPNYGNSWLYLYGWQNGGRFMSDDGRTVTLNDPKIVEALEFMRKGYDILGGREETSKSVAGFADVDSALDAFQNDLIAMKIDTQYPILTLAKYRPDKEFGVALAPTPTGEDFVTWSGGFSLVIPRGARHVEESWELIKWMTSVEASRIEAHAIQEEYRKKGRFYVPYMTAQPKINEIIFHEFAPPVKKFRDANFALLDMIKTSRHRPVTPVGQELWDAQARATELATYGYVDAKTILAEGTRRGQTSLDRILERERLRDEQARTGKGEKAGERIWQVSWALSAAAVLGLVLFAVTKSSRRVAVSGMVRREWGAGFLFALPWLIGFAALFLGPMITSIVLSFCEYDVLHPPNFVGLRNYWDLVRFQSEPGIDAALRPADPLFWKSLWNTIFAVVVGVPLSIVLGLSLALLLNRDVRGIKVYRTALYAPAIVPAVASAVLFRWFLNPQVGTLSYIFGRLREPSTSIVCGMICAVLFALFFGLLAPRGENHKLRVGVACAMAFAIGIAVTYVLRQLVVPNWFGDERWAKLGLIIILLWGAGAGMIIWLAGLKGIPQVFYEAAEMDGAGWWRQFWSITMPMMTPYIFFNLVMGAIAYFKVFTQAYILVGANVRAAGPNDSLLFYVFHLFNNAFQYFKMGYASAMAWVLFGIILALTLVQLRFASRWVYYEGGRQ